MADTDDDARWDTGAAKGISGRGGSGRALKFKCPTCGEQLRPDEVELRFAQAPAASASQRVSGFVCANGHQWPDPGAVRPAHTAAFKSEASASVAPDTATSDGEVEQHLAMLRMAVQTFGLSVDDAMQKWQTPERIRERLRDRLASEAKAPVAGVHVLSAGGRQKWFLDHDPSSGYYWLRMRSYLLSRRGRTLPEITALDEGSDQVLAHVGDPRPGSLPFRTQGLVMGYVQSGKTANFSALIAKAADAGYKLVIVLSGIHNSLRLQTQRRLERELGLAPGEGVTEPEEGRRWIPLTSSDLHGDFRPGTVSADVLQGNERILLVVKKNASVLRRLVSWLARRERYSAATLVIDDEADQASINTGGNRPALEDADLPAEDVDGAADEELDPSTINRLVRDLLRSFDRVSYVAYTATPFANVLINHEAFDREVLGDLYPKDFIVSLDRQEGYVGAERLFGRDPLPGEMEERPGLDVIRLVPEVEVAEIVPEAAEVEDFSPQLVPTLQEAFQDFVLAAAARLTRSAKDLPATMLVHTHHRQVLQERLTRRLRDHVGVFRQTWRYNRDSLRASLARRWEDEFRPLLALERPVHDVGFDSIEEGISRLLKEPLPVLLLNSSSEDELDFDADPTFKGVIVGGNRLSRGLTIEGLLVSYYVRTTNQYDSLMQMGRWFGYREDHVELTRLYTTTELAGWFRDLSVAEEELRREIERYERERITPVDFGPRIRSHPVMLITAKNKMGSARTVQQSYSGRLVQTIMFRLGDVDWLQHNLQTTRELLKRLGPPAEADAGRYTWGGIDVKAIDAFLASYQTDPRANFVDSGAIRGYIDAQRRSGELTNWWVSVRSQRSARGLDTVDLGVVGHSRINTINRSRLKAYPDNIGSLVSPATLSNQPGTGDEEVGLPTRALQRARDLVSRGEHRRVGDALRAVRDPKEAVLLIYPVSQRSKPGANARERVPLFDKAQAGCTVVAIALAFPSSRSAATIEYVVGSVAGEG